MPTAYQMQLNLWLRITIEPAIVLLHFPYTVSNVLSSLSVSHLALQQASHGTTQDRGSTKFHCPYVQFSLNN